MNSTHKNNNLDKYYEYHIYDKDVGYSDFGGAVVVMSRHQGFQWNDELFVSAYRRRAGYESHKSTSLEMTDQITQNKVIDIHLTKADCDVWP